jgi:hypothetical protein
MSSDPIRYDVDSPNDPNEAGNGQIEFLCDPELLGTIPEPKPAMRFAPDWFRNMKREMGMLDAHGLPALTVKACMPVTDALALGFVIPLPYDITFGGASDMPTLQVRWGDDCAFQPIEQHHPGQLGAPDPPFAHVSPLKFINPWRIKVPEGYSVLFQPVMNRPDLPFFCFSGLVDCDRFHTTINFPFIWMGGMHEQLLEAGTPMVQVIPVRRDALIKSHNARASSPEEAAEQALANERKYGEVSTYRKEWRAPK